MPIIPNINNQSIALLSDIEQWKEDIADAINTKGGNSTPDESFQQLAEDIQTLPYAGISAEGIVQTEPFDFISILTTPILSIEELDIKETTNIRITMYRSGTKIDLFPNLRIIRYNHTHLSYDLRVLNNNLLQFIGENVESLEAYTIPYSRIENIVLGRLTQDIDPFYYYADYLSNITIGYNSDGNLNLRNWRGLNITKDILNSNLYNNLLTKLYDHSNDGETRILQIGWLDYITAENIAYANAKGWTITN